MKTEVCLNGLHHECRNQQCMCDCHLVEFWENIEEQDEDRRFPEFQYPKVLFP